MPVLHCKLWLQASVQPLNDIPRLTAEFIAVHFQKAESAACCQVSLPQTSSPPRESSSSHRYHFCFTPNSRERVALYPSQNSLKKSKFTNLHCPGRCFWTCSPSFFFQHSHSSTKHSTGHMALSLPKRASAARELSKKKKKTPKH